MAGNEELVEQAAAGLDDAFGSILSACGSAVYTTALRLTRQPADADDLASETFVQAYRSMQGYSPERIRALRLRPWLLTIALNLWRNQLRTTSRRPATVTLGPVDPATDCRQGPEQTTLDADTTRWVEALLATLPDAQREAIVLRHVVGLPYGEIGEVLSCPVGTVKSNVSRGLAVLRAQLRVDHDRKELP